MIPYLRVILWDSFFSNIFTVIPLLTSFIVKKLSGIDGELVDEDESDDDCDTTESSILAVNNTSSGNELIDK